jgi:hypothetical protein
MILTHLIFFSFLPGAGIPDTPAEGANPGSAALVSIGLRSATVAASGGLSATMVKVSV